MSSNKTVIAVDAMGGDLGPSVVVPGAIEAARQTGAKILLVGNEATLDGELNRLSPSGVDLEIVHAPEVAGMDEKPSDILRRKKNASIQVACRLVRDGAAQGVVSAGHSGASVACGMFIMGRIPGVERPALASLLPTEKEPVVLLDVGATVDCKPYNIFQFGLMGDAFARDILNKESNPLKNAICTIGRTSLTARASSIPDKNGILISVRSRSGSSFSTSSSASAPFSASPTTSKPISSHFTLRTRLLRISSSSSATTTVYFIFLPFSLTVKLSSGYNFSFYIIEDSYPLFHKYISTQICKILRLYTQQ